MARKNARQGRPQAHKAHVSQYEKWSGWSRLAQRIRADIDQAADAAEAAMIDDNERRWDAANMPRVQGFAQFGGGAVL